MAKNRSRRRNPTNSNNGESPTVGNFDTNNINNSATLLPPEDTGSRTTLQSDTDKVEQELNDLYGEIMDLDVERSSLWKIYYDSQSKLQKLQDTLEQRVSYLTDAQVNDLKYQIRETKTTMASDLENAQDVQRRFDEMNNRINVLETGFDTGDTSSWMNGTSMDDEDHGL